VNWWSARRFSISHKTDKPQH